MTFPGRAAGALSQFGKDKPVFTCRAVRGAFNHESPAFARVDCRWDTIIPQRFSSEPPLDQMESDLLTSLPEKTGFCLRLRAKRP